MTAEDRRPDARLAAEAVVLQPCKHGPPEDRMLRGNCVTCVEDALEAYVQQVREWEGW